MKEKLTVSDSKKLFHERFPFVIPGLYKKIVDEMIVELNLLNHQNEFNQDFLFCYGLRETFIELTKGYKPEEHLNLLFESICSSAEFEPKKIIEIHNNSKEDYKEKSIDQISSLLKEKSSSNLYSSRILNLGIYLIISSSKEFSEVKESEQNKIVSDVFVNLNLSFAKAEKDIGLYKGSITKLKQAKELIDELKVKNKKN